MNRPTASADLVPAPVLREERPRAGLLRLTMSSPPANALSEAMLNAFLAAIDAAAKDESVRVVVIAAEGKLFSGGHDLKEMTAHRADPDQGRAYFKEMFGRASTLMQAILHLPKPVVAEVAGIATAGGCQLAASCDIIVAADTARFGVNGIDLGLFCSTPMVALSRNVSPKVALDMLMTGEMISAERARDAGLVSRVVPAAELRAEVDRVVERLLQRPPAVLALGKKAFAEQLRLPVADAYRFATATIVGNMLMEEAEEGIGAFFEKRRPNWTRS
jgi:enoyl-CoA hydratase/carnithine racemase